MGLEGGCPEGRHCPERHTLHQREQAHCFDEFAIRKVKCYIGHTVKGFTDRVRQVIAKNRALRKSPLTRI